SLRSRHSAACQFDLPAFSAPFPLAFGHASPDLLCTDRLNSFDVGCEGWLRGRLTTSFSITSRVSASLVGSRSWAHKYAPRPARSSVIVSTGRRRPPTVAATRRWFVRPSNSLGVSLKPRNQSPVVHTVPLHHVREHDLTAHLRNGHGRDDA